MALPSPFLHALKCILPGNRMQIIISPRLQLRPLTEADADRIAVLAGVWEVASMTGRIPYPYSRVKALQWISDLADGEVVRGIEHQGELIGICGYSPATNGAVEIGYWLGKDYWGKGFATEAARALIGYAFNKAGVKRITCGHFAENAASARVIRKLGFKEIGREPHWCEARQTFVDAVRYEQRRTLTTILKRLAS